MLLKITETTDGKYLGKFVEYNETLKILTLPSGQQVKLSEEDDDECRFQSSNYVVKTLKKF